MSRPDRIGFHRISLRSGTRPVNRARAGHKLAAVSTSSRTQNPSSACQ
jgi:hypothetical protein